VVRLRFWIAWSMPSARADARRQMRFLLEVARPEADIEAAARAYVKRMIWRGELRWHPDLLTRQRVVGFEHLVAARGLGRGVVLNFMHHGAYEGLPPSLARLGAPSHILVFDHLFSDGAPGWLKQHVRVATTGGGTLVSVAAGSQGITDLLGQGLVVALASDVPGRTPLRFVGRELLGSFGAARLAAATGSPVIVATSELDSAGRPFIRLHDPLHPADFASPHELLEEMLARHEPAVLTWPEASEIPLSRWSLPARTPSAEAAQ
jgi:lauroyl/myristoyl acyltransferase